MKRFLSVDWDYFVDATALQRFQMFPDGGNERINYELQDFIWDTHYQGTPDLKKIPLRRDDYKAVFTAVKNFAISHGKHAVEKQYPMVMVSHKHACEYIFNRTKRSEDFEVWNIDFHHDRYCYKVVDEEVNCGNWVDKLQERRPRMIYKWIGREDSDRKIISTEELPCTVGSLADILKGVDFDYVYLCRSDCWSPPHLDMYFDSLWRLAILPFISPIIEQRTGECRKINKLSDSEIKYSQEIAMAKSMKKYPNATCIQCGALIPEGRGSLLCHACEKDPDRVIMT